jgi:transposase InsO family protein
MPVLAYYATTYPAFEKVRIAFAPDCCDREAMSFLATTAGIGGENVRDLMVAAIEHRFGRVHRLPVTIMACPTTTAATSPATPAASHATVDFRSVSFSVRDR